MAFSAFLIGIFVFQFGVAYSQDLKSVRARAEQGDPDAQVTLGSMYDFGREVAQDHAEAARWYRKAAQQGDVRAQTFLGVMYEKGEGVPQDYGEAARWDRMAADQGDAVAQRNLGAAFHDGRGVPQDYMEAVRWLRKSADQGLSVAQSNLGDMYASGSGVQKDYAEAVRWYRKAADQGEAGAQADLGYMYYNGQGVAKDYAEARRWFELAALQGNEYAKQALAMVKQLPQTNTEGISGSSLLWADFQGGEYSFTLSNQRRQSIKNVTCQVIFYDSGGNAIETDVVRYEGIIAAGLSKRLTSKVDLSVRELTTAPLPLGAFDRRRLDPRPWFSREPKTRVEVRVVDIEVVP